VLYVLSVLLAVGEPFTPQYTIARVTESNLLDSCELSDLIRLVSTSYPLVSPELFDIIWFTRYTKLVQSHQVPRRPRSALIPRTPQYTSHAGRWVTLFADAAFLHQLQSELPGLIAQWHERYTEPVLARQKTGELETSILTRFNNWLPAKVPTDLQSAGRGVFDAYLQISTTPAGAPELVTGGPSLRSTFLAAARSPSRSSASRTADVRSRARVRGCSYGHSWQIV
jgi:hypothetical protein